MTVFSRDIKDDMLRKMEIGLDNILSIVQFPQYIKSVGYEDANAKVSDGHELFSKEQGSMRILTLTIGYEYSNELNDFKNSKLKTLEEDLLKELELVREEKKKIGD